MKQEMNDLFSALAKFLAESLEKEDCPATTAEVARKFLSDNGVNMDLDALIKEAQDRGSGRILPFAIREPEINEAEEATG